MARSTATETPGLPELEWDPRRHIKEERSRGEAERTAEPTHNHRIWGIPFITKKGGETSISYCSSSFSHAPWRREHKRSKTSLFHLSYTLLISSTFLPSCLRKVAAGLEKRLLSAKALNTLTSKKEQWWRQFQKPAALISTLALSLCTADL